MKRSATFVHTYRGGATWSLQWSPAPQSDVDLFLTCISEWMISPHFVFDGNKTLINLYWNTSPDPRTGGTRWHRRFINICI